MAHWPAGRGALPPLLPILLLLAPAAEACTYAPQPEGEFFQPATGGDVWLSKGFEIGLYDPAGEDWAAQPLGSLVGGAAADPSGRRLVAMLVDDPYTHYCHMMTGSQREEARAVAFDPGAGAVLELGQDVAWLAGSAGGLAVGSLNRTVAVHRWGDWTVEARREVPVGRLHALSPDLGRLALATESGVQVLPLDGGAAQTVVPGTSGLVELAFAPDSSSLAVLRATATDLILQVYGPDDAGGDGMALLGQRDFPGAATGHLSDLAWGPSGIAVVADGAEDAVHAVEPTLQASRAFPVDVAPRSVSWSRDGASLLYWADDGVQEIRLDGDGPGDPSGTSRSRGAPGALPGFLLLALAAAALAQRRLGAA